jgi:PQQ system protein
MTSTAQERSAVLSEIGLDGQNKVSLGRLLASGTIGRADEGADGRMRAEIRIPPDQ